MTTNMIKKNGNTATQAKPLNNWVDQLLQDNLDRFFRNDHWGQGSAQSQSTVPVNICETDKTYELELVAPGLRKEDFKLQVTNDQLTVSFEKESGQAEENKTSGWLRREYHLRSFTRSFSLDDTVDVNQISAEYNNGILALSITKKPTAQRISRTIEIK